MDAKVLTISDIGGGRVASRIEQIVTVLIDQAQTEDAGHEVEQTLQRGVHFARRKLAIEVAFVVVLRLLHDQIDLSERCQKFLLEHTRDGGGHHLSVLDFTLVTAL